VSQSNPSKASLRSQFVTSNAIPPERIERRILLIRGHKVMLSADLAELYEVIPKVLIQAVKRNRERFPADFMFQLTREELANLKSQIVTSSWGGARRATPYAFTEQGVANVDLDGARTAEDAGKHHRAANFARPQNIPSIPARQRSWPHRRCCDRAHSHPTRNRAD
jgi:ORF6N domain